MQQHDGNIYITSNNMNSDIFSIPHWRLAQIDAGIRESRLLYEEEGGGDVSLLRDLTHSSSVRVVWDWLQVDVLENVRNNK